jgi:hypothetical protein
MCYKRLRVERPEVRASPLRLLETLLRANGDGQAFRAGEITLNVVGG